MPSRFDVAVVVTTCAGRQDNLRRAVGFLYEQTRLPVGLVVVFDGDDARCAVPKKRGLPVALQAIPKHAPGQEQPRNVGFRVAREHFNASHVWFLDSDLITPSDTLEHFYRGLCAAEEDRILIGPYDWLPPDVVGFVPEMEDWKPGEPTPQGMADYRWPSFKEHGPEDVLVNDLGAALACFGGNLVWPVDQFERVGGFHPELYHGRCEDGELGLRAAAAGVPMSFVRNARGWHVWHPVDMQRAISCNQRDVPLINTWHPWVQERGLVVAERDGARFEFCCPQCGEQVNSLDYWPHTQQHER